MTKFSMATQAGEKHVSKGQPRPHPKKGRGPSVPKRFGTHYLRSNGLTYSDEIWYVGVARF